LHELAVILRVPVIDQVAGRKHDVRFRRQPFDEFDGVAQSPAGIGFAAKNERAAGNDVRVGYMSDQH